jgi:hypothetical protein
VEPDERIAVLDAVGETLLSSFGGWTSARPDARVRLRYRGEGLLTAGGDDFEIRWDTGRLEVDVEPDAGIALAVLTAEGTIRIDGTAFAVHTNAEGTRVDVTQGLVRVRCHGVAEHRFAAGEAVRCAPVDPHGVVVAAVTRYRKTGPSACDDVLTDLEWAVDQWPQDGSERVFGMALYARFRCLYQRGDRLGAKAAAEAYMESGLTGNRADVEEYLGRWK